MTDWEKRRKELEVMMVTLLESERLLEQHGDEWNIPHHKILLEAIRTVLKAPTSAMAR